MGLMPPAWTPNKTGQDLRKQDETRAGASARRVGFCCSDGAPHGFCFALLAIWPPDVPAGIPTERLGRRRSHKDGAKEISSERMESHLEGIHRDSIVRTQNDNFVVTLKHRRRIRIRAPRRYKRRPAGASHMAIPRKEQG